MNITAEIVADSINTRGERITTFEIQLPKVLLAELNTHRMVSKNFSSSRAIPTAACNAVENTFVPLYWGKNQPGMVAKEESIAEVHYAASLWKNLVKMCKETSTKLTELGLHKQWSNRCNDWHTMAKGVCTATEWRNFFLLRFHADAQPEIAELAKLMRYCMDTSEPMLLNYNEWHLPYIKTSKNSKGVMIYSTDTDGELSLEDAKIISASCCAQVSYRKNDTSLEKAKNIFEMLNIGKADKIPHFSPLEHQATPMPDIPGFITGVTHMDKHAKFWSGNFCGWIQYRQEVMVRDNINCMG